MREPFAERFGRLREEAGLTKTALAGPRYTTSFVSQIESGRRRPGPEALSFFADRLGVSENHLVTGVPDGVADELAFRLEEARILLNRGETDQADERVTDVLERTVRYGLDPLHVKAVAMSGHVFVREGKVREAIDRFEEALEAGLSGRDAGVATATLARAYESVGDLSYAAELLESYLRGPEAEPLDPSLAAELQTVLVSVYFERGDVVRAERVAARALEALDPTVAPHVRANAFWSASRVLAESKRWDEALEMASRARVILEEVGDRWRLAGVHSAYAFLCLETNPPRPEEAEAHLDVGEQLLGDDSPPGPRAYVHAERSRLALLRDRPADALASVEAALELVGDDRLERGRCLFLKGRSLVGLDRQPEALDSFHEAAAAFAKSGARQQEASCWREIGEVELGAGHVYEAVDALRTGLQALDPTRSRA